MTERVIEGSVPLKLASCICVAVTQSYVHIKLRERRCSNDRTCVFLCISKVAGIPNGLVNPRRACAARVTVVD